MSGSAECALVRAAWQANRLKACWRGQHLAGSQVNIENVDARLTAGHIVGSGTYDTTSKAFDLQGRAEGVQLSRLAALSQSAGNSEHVTGTADFNAHIIGNFSESDFSGYQITFDGQGKTSSSMAVLPARWRWSGRTENKQLNITLNHRIFGATPQVVAAQINLGSEKLAANIETTLTMPT